MYNTLHNCFNNITCKQINKIKRREREKIKKQEKEQK